MISYKQMYKYLKALKIPTIRYFYDVTHPEKYIEDGMEEQQQYHSYSEKILLFLYK